MGLTIYQTCKVCFLSTLQISSCRLNSVLQKQRISGGLPQMDKRGIKPNPRKTPDEDMIFVRQHIDSIPKYVSHYTRNVQKTRKYIDSDLTVAKLYSMYKECCVSANRTPVSEGVYRNCEKNEYNLARHPPFKDTCKRCDIFQIRIDEAKLSANNEQEKELKTMHMLHLCKAEKMRTDMNSIKNNMDDELGAFAFDLQKTLPTPMLSTNEAYYKRQLWTFNLGIHNLKDDQATMYMWHEGIASRGTDEIGSCIWSHIQNYIDNGVTEIITYSDACGGQNRNIKMAALMSYVVSCTPIKIFKMRFMISGHSMLPCDTDFGIIERSKPKSKSIYTPYEWENIVKTAKKKIPRFKVVSMKSEDIMNIGKLAECFVKRKKNTEGHPVKWLDIRTITFKKENPMQMHYVYSCNQDDLGFTLDLHRRDNRGRRRSEIGNIQLDMLYPGGHLIKQAKLTDLIHLLQYIPENPHHSFYKNLKAESSRQRNDEEVFIDELLYLSGSEEDQ